MKLGSLVSVWTTHVSLGDAGIKASSATTTTTPKASTLDDRLFANIFPERDQSCYFRVYEEYDGIDDDAVCRTPLGYEEQKALPGLMTLKNLVDGGYEIEGCKILVCVKSIGCRKKGEWWSGA